MEDNVGFENPMVSALSSENNESAFYRETDIKRKKGKTEVQSLNHCCYAGGGGGGGGGGVATAKGCFS